ncbi:MULTISPECIES: hypothetical protein [Streptomyces]|uniref:hypothetical protein n=1 Tax=Streptomyces TaxID=1883 RepID=UPI0004AADDE6|nr:MULTISPECIES: hypothetical protein [Streptomyces]
MSNEPYLPTETQYSDLRAFVRNLERQAELEQRGQKLGPAVNSIYLAWDRMAIGYVALLGKERATPEAVQAATRAWRIVLEMLEVWRDNPLLPESLREPVKDAARYY